MLKHARLNRVFELEKNLTSAVRAFLEGTKGDMPLVGDMGPCGQALLSLR
jgi:hypothetical protein